MTTKRVPRPVLWLAALGLLLMASACGSDPNAEAIANDKATMAAMATSIAAEQAAEPAATDTPAPTATPAPTDTPVPTETPPPTSTLAVQRTSGDSLNLPSPTPEPVTEGIIVFLSSRDHEPQTEAERQSMRGYLAGYLALELYGMRPDGSQQTRLSDGTHTWMQQNNYTLSTFLASYQVLLFGQDVFSLNAKEVTGQLSVTLHDTDAETSTKPAYPPELSSNGEPVFMSNSRNASSFAIFTVNQMGTALQLTDPPSNVWGDGFPAWSPNGEWIVFCRDWEGQDQDGLWLVNADGSETHRVFQKDTGQFNARRASWSPDGNKLAFEGPKQNTDNFLFELWVTDTTGNETKQLTSLPPGIGIWEPRWSPDGKRIVYTTETRQDSSVDIYVIDAKGGSPQQLTFEGAANLSPLWLPLDADEILAGGDTPLQEPPTPTPRPQAPAAQPAKATNCPSPGVEISSPAAGSRFTQRNNFIVGTANIPRFHHWRIEYATDPNGGWSYLLERDYPVDNDKLAMIDASTIPNGPYGLRLTVVDETGNYPEPCEVWFTNGY